MADFTKKVCQIVRNIPKGRVLSYREVAELAGSPRGYRAVGSIMRKNQDPTIPCHRVIKTGGRPGQYNGGEKEKELRLIAECARLDSGADIKYTIVRNYEGGH